jgi:hypothetical protein
MEWWDSEGGRLTERICGFEKFCRDTEEVALVMVVVVVYDVGGVGIARVGW